MTVDVTLVRKGIGMTVDATLVRNGIGMTVDVTSAERHWNDCRCDTSA